MYITSSDSLRPEIRTMLESNDRLVVSGQPIQRISPEGVRVLFDDCNFEPGVEVQVESVLIKTIPHVGHNHLPPKYLGEYPSLNGFASDGSFFTFGMRDELGFSFGGSE